MLALVTCDGAEHLAQRGGRGLTLIRRHERTVRFANTALGRILAADLVERADR
jgi:hypothetical protein